MNERMATYEELRDLGLKLATVAQAGAGLTHILELHQKALDALLDGCQELEERVKKLEERLAGYRDATW